jgi:HPt (histidine-containing phosphotransfer) domain-containing protein
LKEEVDKSLEAGCNGHQSKPVAKASLVKCIEEFTKNLDIIVDKDLEDLIPDYIGNREKEVVTLTDLFLKKEFPQIQAIGHKLRGSAGSYGFSELSDIGKELEEKAKVADSTSINHALNQYRLYLKRIKVSFQ